MRPELKEAITGLGLEYRLMTQFTSFVAVEEMIVTDGGQPRRIDVPVEVPEGVNRAMVFREEEQRSGTFGRLTLHSNLSRAPATLEASETVTVTSSPARKRAPRRGGNISGGDADKGGSRGSGGGGTGGGGANSAVRTGNVQIDGVSDADTLKVTVSPEEQKRQQLIAKLHPSLVAVVDRLRAKAAASPEEAKFVRDGKAELHVWLTDKSPEALAELKQLGFEIILDPRTSKLVIGRLAIENLQKLAELKFVRYVTPQTAKIRGV